MKFALNGVGSGSTVRPQLLVQVTQKAEALGYESLWIPEHLAVPVTFTTPYPYSADGKFPGGPGVALHDPLVALAFVAACPETIKLGTGVFVLPLRNPLTVAKARSQRRYAFSKTTVVWDRYRVAKGRVRRRWYAVQGPGSTHARMGAHDEGVVD